jgi:hypothetical protein
MQIVIHKDSHWRDHGLTEAHLDFIVQRYAILTGSESTGVWSATFELPAIMGDGIPSALYGPSAGDAPIKYYETTWRARGDRKYPSRLVARPMRRTRTITIVVGPHADLPMVLYTAFGGPKAPREIFDPTLAGAANDRELDESLAFWATHALSIEAV